MSELRTESDTKVVLQRIELGAREVLSREELHGAAGTLRARIIDDCGRRLAIQLKTHILGIEGEQITVSKQWPRDWWQAVRERFMPQWWLLRHPVVYDEINIDERQFLAVCPHVHIESPDRHIEWMVLATPAGKEASQ